MRQNLLIFSPHMAHAEEIYAALNKYDISVSIVFDAQEAVAFLITNPPDFFWLDVDIEAAQIFLTEISNRTLRPPPYIILTSSFSNSEIRAVLLDLGADTCIETPVNLSEILAVLNAVLRREERLNRTLAGDLPPCITHKRLFINPWTHEVKMCEQLIVLTHTEYKILYMLASNPGTTFSRQQIYSSIWKEAGDIGTSIVTDHISSLRRKLGLLPQNEDYIKTVYKVGYRFAEPE
ncbi:MAG: response regulator transcription factor [Oscillibacter sp.]|nr:response regulator transcription factor [Oscillibacter sp.]